MKRLVFSQLSMTAAAFALMFSGCTLLGMDVASMRLALGEIVGGFVLLAIAAGTFLPKSRSDG